MKKILFLLIAVTFLVQAFAQENNFEIKYNVRGITSNKASVTIFGDKSAVRLDTGEENVIDITNGRFILKGYTKESFVARIWLREDRQLLKQTTEGAYLPSRSTQFWLVVSPGAHFIVNGDIVGKDYADVFPSNDKENAILADFNSKTIPLISRALNNTLRVYYGKLNDDQSKFLNSCTDSLNKLVLKIQLDLINNNPSSITALWLMEDMLVRSQVKTEFLEPILNKVTKEYRDHYLYRAVNDRVEGAKRAKEGAKLQEICGTLPSGERFTSKSLKGKFIIVDFWGTWCGSCLAGTPRIKEFRDKYVDKVEIVGVAQDSDINKWKKCVENMKMNWPNILSVDGDVNYVNKFSVQGFPTKLLINPNGRIVYRVTGESPEFYKIAEEFILGERK